MNYRIVTLYTAVRRPTIRMHSYNSSVTFDYSYCTGVLLYCVQLYLVYTCCAGDPGRRRGRTLRV